MRRNRGLEVRLSNVRMSGDSRRHEPSACEDVGNGRRPLRAGPWNPRAARRAWEYASLQPTPGAQTLACERDLGSERAPEAE